MSVEMYEDPTDEGVPNRFYRERQPEVVRPPTVQRLTEWAESARAAYEVASKLVMTSFVPHAFRCLDPENTEDAEQKSYEATAAILAGDEVGLSPMASLRAFDVIKGTAAPKAITHRAVVQSHGHKIWVAETNSNRAIVRGRRAGDSEVQESEWTIERARQLGLLGREGWKTQPKAMLIARATSECCRLVASDALMGMPYSVEELTDGVVEEIEGPQPGQPTTAPPARRTARRRTQLRAASAEPPSPVEPAPEEPSGPPLPGEDDRPDEAAAALITNEQQKALQTLFTDAGISDRSTRLTASSLIIGREITSATELTQEEAARLLTQLTEWNDAGDLAVVIAELVDRGSEPPEVGG